jgi:putative PIN family toxin of toxin-antitoxin system
MKCVLDTDVIVASLRSDKGASREIIRRVGRGQIRAYASIALLLEYEAVLKRSEHLQATGLNIEQIDIWLDGLTSLLIPVAPHFLWRPILGDPNDEMVLEASINSQADSLVTFNVRHFQRAANLFGITAMTPADFLRRIRS